MPHSTAANADTALSSRYGHWGSHPRFSREWWKREVANDDTGLGYWAWVESQIERVADGFRALIATARAAGIRRVVADAPQADAIIRVALVDKDLEVLDVADVLFDELVDWMRAIAQEVRAATAWATIEQVTVDWEEEKPPTYSASGGLRRSEGPLPVALGGAADLRAGATA